MQKRKDKWHRIELLSVVSVVLVLFGIFIINSYPQFLNLEGNRITGFVSSDVLSQDVNVVVEKSQVFTLSAQNNFYLKSLRLSGSVDGPGAAQIFLRAPSGEQYLIYQNVKKNRKGNLITGYSKQGNKITGYAVKDAGSPQFVMEPGEALSQAPRVELAEDEMLASGAFYQECAETCFISLPVNPENSYELVFSLDEGTSLSIDQIIYIIG